ncbi:MAG: (d)CMP kinase [Pirellulales bacterium]|nr:(d)CMP kinase [Pirellulales bacterium]
MIVTIDGPAGAGKTSATRGLAERLGFRFLDTGAMYRAVTLAGIRQRVDWQDEAALARITAGLELVLTGDRVFMNGEDVTQAIRTQEVTGFTHYAADNRSVRLQLVQHQRDIAAGINVVTDGRDQATDVFPGAECKIFLTASDQVRARRRYEELRGRGEEVAFEEVLTKQIDRDRRDQDRQFGGLHKVADSIEVNTDGLSTEEVIDRLEKIVRKRWDG